MLSPCIFQDRFGQPAKAFFRCDSPDSPESKVKGMGTNQRSNNCLKSFYVSEIYSSHPPSWCRMFCTTNSGGQPACTVGIEKSTRAESSTFLQSQGASQNTIFCILYRLDPGELLTLRGKCADIVVLAVSCGDLAAHELQDPMMA